MIGLPQLVARDFALYERWALAESAPRATVIFWRTVTHIGGIGFGFFLSVAIVLTALLGEGHLQQAALQASCALIATQAIVQLAKRLVTRQRPVDVTARHVHVEVPDRFSFPSGHAAWAMAVACIGAATFRDAAPAFLTGAMLVGLSRVRLGVHYPGDVVIGQLIAIAASVVVLAAW
jgi:undecaprenyl-diphosphatase